MCILLLLFDRHPHCTAIGIITVQHAAREGDQAIVICSAFHDRISTEALFALLRNNDSIFSCAQVQVMLTLA